MTSGYKALWLLLLTVQLPMLQAQDTATGQDNDHPTAAQQSKPADITSFEKKLDRFLQAFDAVKVQKANKLKDQLLPDMQREVQYLNEQIRLLKEQLKQAREDTDPQTGEVRQQAMMTSLTEQLKAISQRNQRMSFIHKHLKAYPFQARNIKTAGVVRKDMLLEFVELMKASRTAADSQPASKTTDPGTTSEGS